MSDSSNPQLFLDGAWAEVEGTKKRSSRVKKTVEQRTVEALLDLNLRRSTEQHELPATAGERLYEPPNREVVAGQFWNYLKAKHVAKAEAIDVLRRCGVDISAPEKLEQALERLRTHITGRRNFTFQEQLCDWYLCSDPISVVAIEAPLPGSYNVRVYCSRHRQNLAPDCVVQEIRSADGNVEIRQAMESRLCSGRRDGES